MASRGAHSGVQPAAGSRWTGQLTVASARSESGAARTDRRLGPTTYSVVGRGAGFGIRSVAWESWLQSPRFGSASGARKVYNVPGDKGLAVQVILRGFGAALLLARSRRRLPGSARAAAGDWKSYSLRTASASATRDADALRRTGRLRYSVSALRIAALRSAAASVRRTTVLNGGAHHGDPVKPLRVRADLVVGATFVSLVAACLFMASTCLSRSV